MAEIIRTIIADYFIGNTAQRPFGYLPLSGWTIGTINNIMLPGTIYLVVSLLIAIVFFAARRHYKSNPKTDPRAAFFYAALCSLIIGYAFMTARGEVIWTSFVKYSHNKYSSLSLDEKYGQADTEGLYGEDAFLAAARQHVKGDYHLLFTDGPISFDLIGGLLLGKARFALLPAREKAEGKYIVVIGKKAEYDYATKTLVANNTKITGLEMVFPYSKDKFVLAPEK